MSQLNANKKVQSPSKQVAKQFMLLFSEKVQGLLVYSILKIILQLQMIFN